MLKENERLDDLGLGGYGVIQDTSGFCFGSDAVLLAAFAGAQKGRVLDLCAGSGVVAVLLWILGPPKSVDALELVPEVADMAARTMSLNGLSEKIRVTEGDALRAPEIYGKRVFDAVVCNPPYMNKGGGLVNPDAKKAAARHEIYCGIRDIARVCSQVLCPRGKLFLVHRADRLCDVLCALREFSLEPKRMSLVHSRKGDAASLVLIEALLGGRPQIKVTPPVFLYGEDGKYIAPLGGIAR